MDLPALPCNCCNTCSEPYCCIADPQKGLFVALEMLGDFRTLLIDGQYLGQYQDGTNSDGSIVPCNLFNRFARGQNKPIQLRKAGGSSCLWVYDDGEVSLAVAVTKLWDCQAAYGQTSYLPISISLTFTDKRSGCY